MKPGDWGKGRFRGAPDCWRAFAGAVKSVPAVLLVAAAVGAGCTTILGDFDEADESTGAASGAGGSAVTASATGGGGQGSTSGAGGASTGGGVTCPSGSGPGMVPVDPPFGVAPYCIDSTEVTIAQYADWLSKAPSLEEQPEFCASWNTTYDPAISGGFCEFFNFQEALAMRPERPIVCVDWCDADAYCRSAGKRLCGRIEGGTNAPGSSSDPAESQWYRACSRGGTRSFPYGDVFNPQACVGLAYDGDPAFDINNDVARGVKEALLCEGGYPGLFGMSGNVWEWEDSCNGTMGKDDSCLSRAGSFLGEVNDLACDSAYPRLRSNPFTDVGFRCCAEAVTMAP